MIVPVIHCLNWHQIKTNLETCRKNGVEMVFLINHRPGPDSAIDLEKWFGQAKSEFPEIKIGINFLQLNTEDSIDSCNRIGSDAIWTDYPGTGIRNSPLFGSVAFKYQKHVPDDKLGPVCLEAMKNMDVICTSGPATGKPASIRKIELIREHIGNFPLALASGINEENKKIFDSLVDYMLVASSITDGNEIIIDSKLNRLINI